MKLTLEIDISSEELPQLISGIKDLCMEEFGEMPVLQQCDVMRGQSPEPLALLEQKLNEVMQSNHDREDLVANMGHMQLRDAFQAVIQFIRITDANGA